MAVGPQNGQDGTTPSSGRQSKTGETVTCHAHGKYYEAASRGAIFCAGDQGVGLAVQVTLTTTCMFSLHNPPGSQVNISIGRVSIAYFSGTLGAGAFYHGFLGVGSTLPVVGGGVTLTSNCMGVGVTSGKTAYGVALTTSTVTAGKVFRPFASSFPTLASSVVGPFSPATEDLDGAIVLAPGAQYQLLGVFGGTGSSPKISVGIEWEEIPFAGANG